MNDLWSDLEAAVNVTLHEAAFWKAYRSVIAMNRRNDVFDYTYYTEVEIKEWAEYQHRLVLARRLFT